MRTHDRRGSVLPGRDSGATLIEVVIATVLLGVLSAAVLGILFSTQASSVDSRNRVAASNLAAREIDLVREQFGASEAGPLTVANAGTVMNPHPLPGGTAGQPLVLDGVAYTVVRSVAWNVVGTGASACEGGSVVAHPTLLVTATVTWPGMGTTEPVTNTVALAPERGAGLPTTASFVAVAVKNAAGQPSAGRTVVVSSGSETRSSVTDSSGCAVIAVNPSASGTSYTARFPDTGYVDISGTTNPQRTIGMVMRGQLVANLEISLDRAATLVLRIVGDGVSAADAVGADISLYASETSAGAVTSYPLTGLTTTIGNLWPTQYAAFFGSEIPPSLEHTADLAPGATVNLDVPFQFAEFAISGVPPAAGTVRAVAPGDACTAPTARTVNPSAGRLPAGTWSFFLHSAELGCSEGPGSIDLGAGVNSTIEWAPSTLTVSGAPTGQGAVWAAPAAVGDCATANAVRLAPDGGTVGPVELPAGDWYLYVMPDAGGTPSGDCISSGLVAVPYGQARSFSWTTAPSLLVVTGAPTGSSGDRVFISGNASMSCGWFGPSGSHTYLTRSGSTYQGTVTPGDYFVYHWRTLTTTCNGGHPVTIGYAPQYTLNFGTGAVTTP